MVQGHLCRMGLLGPRCTGPGSFLQRANGLGNDRRGGWGPGGLVGSRKALGIGQRWREASLGHLGTLRGCQLLDGERRAQPRTRRGSPSHAALLFLGAATSAISVRWNS